MTLVANFKRLCDLNQLIFGNMETLKLPLPDEETFMETRNTYQTWIFDMWKC